MDTLRDLYPHRAAARDRQDTHPERNYHPARTICKPLGLVADKGVCLGDCWQCRLTSPTYCDDYDSEQSTFRNPNSVRRFEHGNIPTFGANSISTNTICSNADSDPCKIFPGDRDCGYQCREVLRRTYTISQGGLRVTSRWSQCLRSKLVLSWH